MAGFPRRRGRLGLAALVTLSMAAAACGDDAGSADDTSPEVTSVTGSEVVAADVPSTEAPATEAPATEAPATEAPATETPTDTDVADDALRIVSLSPTHTEMLFAIGAGDQLVAVDDQSNYPAEALELPHELSSFEPSVEAIAAYEPDLVVIGGDFTGLGDQLSSVSIESWDGPAAATIDDTYTQIRQLGEITAEVEGASELVEQMQGDIAAIIESTPQPAEPLRIYHELDPTLYSATSDTFIGQVYNSLGLRNVADELETDSGPFPKLSAEFLVSTNPDMVFLADTKCCGETADTVAARPGWDSVTAVQTGNVIEMDDDIASRWGPRTVDYLAAVAAAVEHAIGS